MIETASDYYNKGTADRKIYEDRAKVIAKLTVPYLIRDESATSTTQMEDSNAQSYGARLVNTLKAKMGMALLPPSTSSFRFLANPAELAALTQGNADNAAKVNNLLSQSTISVNNELENQQVRPTLFELIAQMIVVGSVIAEKIEDDGIVLHTLMGFVVTLDAQGKPIKMCINETIAKENLPDDITPKEDMEEYSLYTIYQMEDEGKKWIMSQELQGGEPVGTEKTFKDYDDLPVRYFGWTWMVGDKYHRPYAEDYFKDLEQLDRLAALLTDGSIVAAKTLLFVNERGGRTRKDTVADSINGDVVDGSAEDVTALTLGKNYDFQVPMEREQNLKRELASAFLLNESATRDAERVTAEEIRFMAQELETSTLAGVYSTLSVDWSKWIVQKVMKEIGISFKEVSVDILTGLDALGRSQQSQKLDNYLARLGQLQMMDWVNQGEVASRYAAYEGIEVSNLLKSAEEVAQARKAQADAAAAQAGAEAGAVEGGKQGAQAAAANAQPPPA